MGMNRRNEMSEIKCEGCGNWFTPRNNETTACDECNEKAELEEGTGETPTEAERMTCAGRSWPALKESKSFDTERLNESPLFDRRLF